MDRHGARHLAMTTGRELTKLVQQRAYAIVASELKQLVQQALPYEQDVESCAMRYLF